MPGIVREIGPGVTMTINTVARRGPRRGRGTADGKLLNSLRDISDHLKANNGDALRDADITALQSRLDTLLEVRARNGAQTNRLEAAHTRLGPDPGAVNEAALEHRGRRLRQDAIQFNSQSAAYQAALRAGANIVQSSLMDFLR